MNIAPISISNINSYGKANNNSKVSFSGLDTEKNWLMTCLAISGTTGLVGINAGRGIYTAKLIKTVENISKSPEIKKDTFTVKDINGDEKSELILYKKDGSKIAIDLTSCDVLEEKKAWEKIE